MTASLYTLTHNIRNAAQLTIRAFLRRAVLYLERKPPTNHRRFFYFRRFGSNWGYLKFRR